MTPTSSTPETSLVMDVIECHADAFVCLFANMIFGSFKSAWTTESLDSGNSFNAAPDTIEGSCSNEEVAKRLGAAWSQTAVICEGLSELLMPQEESTPNVIMRGAPETTDISKDGTQNCSSNPRIVPILEQACMEKESDSPGCWKCCMSEQSPTCVIGAAHDENNAHCSEVSRPGRHQEKGTQVIPDMLDAPGQWRVVDEGGPDSMIEALSRTNTPTSLKVPQVLGDDYDGTQMGQKNEATGSSDANGDNLSLYLKDRGASVPYRDGISQCYFAPPQASFREGRENLEAGPRLTREMDRASRHTVQSSYSSDPVDVYFELMGLS